MQIGAKQMSMDLRRLRTFVAVVELGTVSKAALHLHISQSALSRQISDLEQDLRVRLFDRVGRRLVLTAIGEELLEDCRSLASYPLLLLEAGYSVRVQFNAACHLANVKPNILFESRAPHTLLALAEAKHGVAIIPSLLRTDRYELSILRVAHRGKPLREGLVVQWDNRRPILPYAANFREALAEHMREVFSMTQPSKGKSALARKQVAVARARRQ